MEKIKGVKARMAANGGVRIPMGFIRVMGIREGDPVTIIIKRQGREHSFKLPLRSNARVYIPKTIREAMGLKEGDSVMIMAEGKDFGAGILNFIRSRQD